MKLSACLLIVMQARAAAAFASSVHTSGVVVTPTFRRATRSKSVRYLSSGSGSNCYSGQYQSKLFSPIFGGLRGGSCSLNDASSAGNCGGSTSRYSAGRPPAGLRASTPASSAATTASSTSDNDKPYNVDSDKDMQREIADAALASRHITGPSTKPATFGSIPFLDTSALDSSTPSKQHRVLFVLGGPGAGKGTQSDLIVDNYKCVHLSVGELLREARASDSNPHAELIEDCLVHGKIVPVEISLQLLQTAMDEAYKQPAADGSKYGTRLFLVDGFPRNFDNLQGWTANMPHVASCLGALVYDCPQDVLEARIMSRAETSGRSDDNLTSARKRFKTFQMQTMPVVLALEEVEKAQDAEEPLGTSRIRVTHIEATGTVDEVWDATRAAMDGYVLNDVLSANSRLIRAAVKGDAESYMKLCDTTMFAKEDEDASKFGDDKLKSLFKEYERPGGNDGTDNDDENIWNTVISNASVEMQSGTKAIVSYDRTFTADGNEEKLRETRVWSHGENGWTCIFFYRKPL